MGHGCRRRAPDDVSGNNRAISRSSLSNCPSTPGAVLEPSDAGADTCSVTSDPAKVTRGQWRVTGLRPGVRSTPHGVCCVSAAACPRNSLRRYYAADVHVEVELKITVNTRPDRRPRRRRDCFCNSCDDWLLQRRSSYHRCEY